MKISRFTMSKPTYVTIDIGGTKTRTIAYDENYQITNVVTTSTENFSVGQEKFFADVLEWVRSQYTSISKLGIAVNGPVHENTVVFSSLAGGAVSDDVAEMAKDIYGASHVVIENDVYALAKGVNWSDSSCYHNFTLVNLGTGIRLAQVTNGELYKGSTSNAGEVSQKEIYVKELDLTLKMDNFLSGKGFTQMYYTLTGITKSAEDICKLEDREARLVFSIFSEYFIHFIYDISYFYNPEKIVLSSSLTYALSQLCEQINQRLENAKFRFLMPEMVEIKNEDYYVNNGMVALLEETY